MWLPWEYAAWLAGALLVLAIGVRVLTPGRHPALQSLGTEGCLIALLYAMWQRIGELSTNSTGQAEARGRHIVSIEKAWHLPSEVWTQHLALHSHLLIKGANWYYIAAHAPIMGVFLVWMWGWQRDAFPRWRTTLGVASIVGELIQIVPVAPPRLTIPGIIDTGLVFHPSVYEADGRGGAPQLAAMPSLHCVWAITIGIAVWKTAPGRWRWLGPVHAVFTVVTVVITGNHYWLDAIAGGALVVLGMGVHEGASRLWARRPRAQLPEARPSLVSAA